MTWISLSRETSKSFFKVLKSVVEYLENSIFDLLKIK